jgi:glycogen(starch) synthase
MKVRSRSGSVMSGASTPGGGAFKSLSEGDLKKADAALSQVNGVSDNNGSGNGGINGAVDVKTS